MCGIVGLVSDKDFSVKDDLLSMLSRLEYRGYDSAGFATSEGIVQKEVGYIKNLRDKTLRSLASNTAISHTRWATHGGVSKVNSHPHLNNDRDLFVVHNGIIENFKELTEWLEKKGKVFISKTDTEVIAHYFDYYLKQGYLMNDIIVRFMRDIVGTYAILILQKASGKIYSVKKDSPLILGVGKEKYCFASDTSAFSEDIHSVVLMDDYEFCVASKGGYQFYNSAGHRILKSTEPVNFNHDLLTKGEHDYFMIKEIKEQPLLVSGLLDSLENNQGVLEIVRKIHSAKHVVLLGCGTSYHAALIAESAFRQVGIDARAVIASEFTEDLVKSNSVVFAASQSGETMDVLMVLKKIKVPVYSIVNSVHSSLARFSDFSINIMAGPEICVASTKAFTNQVIVFLFLAKKLGLKIDLSGLPTDLAGLISGSEEFAKEISSNISARKSVFVLGKNASFAAAHEIALKLKEICYIHAEAIRSGELKHGTMALIEKGTPIIALIADPTTENAVKEVQARGAEVISLSVDVGFKIPSKEPHLFALYASIIGHLISYYVGLEKGLPIDKPRNLAKSVTVL